MSFQGCALKSSKRTCINNAEFIFHGECSHQPEDPSVFPANCVARPKAGVALRGLVIPILEGEFAGMTAAKGVHGVACAHACAADSRCTYYVDHTSKGCTLKATSGKNVKSHVFLGHGDCIHAGVANGCQDEGQSLVSRANACQCVQPHPVAHRVCRCVQVLLNKCARTRAQPGKDQLMCGTCDRSIFSDTTLYGCA